MNLPHIKYQTQEIYRAFSAFFCGQGVMSQLIHSSHNTQLTQNYFDNNKKTITERSIFLTLFKKNLLQKIYSLAKWSIVMNFQSGLNMTQDRGTFIIKYLRFYK
jgi:hypothetical protein